MQTPYEENDQTQPLFLQPRDKSWFSPVLIVRAPHVLGNWLISQCGHGRSPSSQRRYPRAEHSLHFHFACDRKRSAEVRFAGGAVTRGGVGFGRAWATQEGEGHPAVVVPPVVAVAPPVVVAPPLVAVEPYAPEVIVEPPVVPRRCLR